jgi:hypothetical protein
MLSFTQRISVGASFANALRNKKGAPDLNALVDLELPPQPVPVLIVGDLLTKAAVNHEGPLLVRAECEGSVLVWPGSNWAPLPLSPLLLAVARK